MLRSRGHRPGLPVLPGARRHTNLFRRLLLCQHPREAGCENVSRRGGALDTQLHTTQYKRDESACQAQKGAAMKPAATNTRTFRSFLLMSQLAAKEIGGRIALARNEKGLTQDELSDMASFSKRALQGWEAGSNIPYRQMQELSALLARPVEWFLHGESPEDVGSLPLEPRLAELAGAVSALGVQFQEATTAVLARLEAIERRLPSPTAQARPKGAGRRVSGSR